MYKGVSNCFSPRASSVGGEAQVTSANRLEAGFGVTTSAGGSRKRQPHESPQSGYLPQLMVINFQLFWKLPVNGNFCSVRSHSCSVWRPQKGLFPHWPKVRELGLVSSSFKVIVYLPQTKVPPNCKSESSALSRWLSTGVANSQP